MRSESGGVDEVTEWGRGLMRSQWGRGLMRSQSGGVDEVTVGG